MTISDKNERTPTMFFFFERKTKSCTFFENKDDNNLSQLQKEVWTFKKIYYWFSFQIINLCSEPILSRLMTLRGHICGIYLNIHCVHVR